ncbi:UvrD-helicase domain-containing protein [Aestuariibaculum sp. YM273]|uniref:UvrD-helicase domain-containing protein n=1 Tax=Aestuariibaculum sp. YM273 TaxID=3070659 RepID=UPI0027DB10D7|nr:UvrD-helicase domain-containing protein [Aestuariibaculum sp. YM273]WMI66782.1 UvrD-helicase domain-containing protein [Aestuariibaculum sp. YM273]
MLQTPPFTIYNASAGSGKTFTLVKEYLKILFKSDTSDQFKRILAITFTNKAVAEMKERIIEVLKQFSEPEILEKPNTMFNLISEDLNIAPEALHEKSIKLLNTIIHNYAAFDISTIDGFTHKLIRTFAYDLKLPINFEVELDQDTLLNQAVDSLIAKAGSDKTLTNILVEFALEKADDDKNFDIAFDFNKIAKLLVNENDIPYIETLKDKTLADFNTLKSQLKKDIKSTEEVIIEGAQNILELIEGAGLEFGDFSGSYLPKHFKKISDGNFDVAFTSKWQEDIETRTLYPKKVSSDIASTIESIQPQIASAFNLTKQAIFHVKFLKAFYKNITPLSVLNAINKELKSLKLDQNKMLISEFNTIISQEISNQPTPFVYERLGEKFNHYFIDEFQDTSVMQWQNLIPLLDSSLSADKGTTMLVGDAKQAIYRWRGGKAEQFIDLFLDKNPFHVEKALKNLPANFRSFREVVDFNNKFFEFLAHQVFSNNTYKNLYEKGHQDISKNENGYVELSFLDLDKEDDRDERFCEQVLNTINRCLDNNFKLEDICVLVRKKKEGVAVANYLSQSNIPIISSETLLIHNAPEVVFLNNALKLLIQPKNNEVKIAVLNYLVDLFHIENKHDFFSQHLKFELPELFKSFEDYNVYVNSNYLLQLPLYDLVETLVRSFNLVENSNAYIQFYLDIVLDFSHKKGSDIGGFLDYFDTKKETLSIVSPKGQDAVQIMTIHKSKGLEFPVVIFPYADLDIYREIEPKEWFPINNEVYQGFSHTLLNFNKDFEYFGDIGLDIYNNHRSEQELDNINLLYVALTRPVEQLYILSTKDLNAKGLTNSNKYSGLFINYLQHIALWNNNQTTYSFGSPEKTVHEDSATKETITVNDFISTAKEDHNINVVTKSGMLWDTNQEEAIEKGNLVHNIMSKIISKNDINSALSEFLSVGTINQTQASQLKGTIFEIVNHPSLEPYFQDNLTVYNERDIISKEGIILRPDRIILLPDNQSVIIDYKTGMEDKKHAQQLQTYQDVLNEMDISVMKKILIYTNKEITIKEV